MNKCLRYNPQDNNYVEKCLQFLEPRVVYYSYRYGVRGLLSDDLAQMMREKLFRCIRFYYPDMSSLDTWGSRVLKNFINDISNPRKYKIDQLDAPSRVDMRDEL